MDSTWGADNDMNSSLQDLDLIADNGTTDASVYLNSDEFSDLLKDKSDLLSELSSGGDNEGLSVHWAGINDLQDGNCEASSFSSSRLSLEIN